MCITRHFCRFNLYSSPTPTPFWILRRNYLRLNKQVIQFNSCIAKVFASLQSTCIVGQNNSWEKNCTSYLSRSSLHKFDSITELVQTYFPPLCWTSQCFRLAHASVFVNMSNQPLQQTRIIASSFNTLNEPNSQLRISAKAIFESQRRAALWLRIDQKTSKLNIFASNRRKCMKFRMNTTNMCSYLLTMNFFTFFFFELKKMNFFLEIFPFESRKIKFSNFNRRETSLQSKPCAICRSLIISFTHFYILFLLRAYR